MGGSNSPHALESYINRNQELCRALAIQEEQFDGVFESSAIGMAIVSLEGQWIKVNNSLLKILGYQKEQLYRHKFQDITHPDDLATDLHLVQQLIDGKKQSYQMEKRYFSQSGLTIWVLLSVSLVRDDKGRPVHFVSQIIDITEHKQLARLRLTEMDRINSRIAFELHENIAQTIASIRLYLSSAVISNAYEEVKLSDVDNRLNDLIEEITTLSKKVAPTTFLHENMFDLINGIVVKYCITHNIKMDLQIDAKLKDMNFASSYHLFKIVEDQLKLAVLQDVQFIQLCIKKEQYLVIDFFMDGADNFKDVSDAQRRLLVNNIKTRLDILGGTTSGDSDFINANPISIRIPCAW